MIASCKKFQGSAFRTLKDFTRITSENSTALHRGFLQYLISESTTTSSGILYRKILQSSFPYHRLRQRLSIYCQNNSLFHQIISKILTDLQQGSRQYFYSDFNNIPIRNPTEYFQKLQWNP